MVADSKLQLEQADYSAASEKGLEALSIGKKALSSGDLKFGEIALFECYKILAETSSAMGKLDQAKKYADDALALKDLSKSDQAYGQVLLASIQFELKQYEVARKSLEAALALNDSNDKTLEKSTFTQAATLLGFTLERLGKLKGESEALNQLGWALSWDKTNPSSNGLLATARDYNGLALVETALVAVQDKDGDSERAKYYALEGSRRIDKYIEKAFPGLSIGQQCSFLAIAKQQRDALLTTCKSKESIGQAYEFMRKWKGLLLESLRRKGAIKVAVENNPELKKKQEQLEEKIRLVAALSNQGSDTAGGEEAKIRYRKATDERQQLERDLSAASGVTLKDPLSQMELKTFRALLKADEAFVDVLSYKPLTEEKERYAAIAMKASDTGEPEFFDLGSQEEVDQLIHRWRYSVTGSKSELSRELGIPDDEPQQLLTDKEFAAQSGKVSDLLLTNSMLQNYLGSSVKRIWLCPEGEFGRIPWNAIAYTNGSAVSPLIAEVDSPREFVFLRTDSGKVAAAKSQKLLLAGLSDFGRAGLDKLPGALKEVTRLKEVADSLHRTVEYLPEENATKDSVKTKLTEVAHAHIATHGFAAGGNLGGSGGRGSRAVRFTMRTGGGVKLGTARNPLSDCGIYLAYPKDDAAAGANGAGQAAADKDPETTSNDFATNKKDMAPNILTADEIIGLNLSNCEIVTLSACHTGLGRTLNGQGVIGLRSAIIGAGAKSVLMSLWSVPDAATQELMKQYYLNLWQKKMPKQEALADAQAFIRRQKNGRNQRTGPPGCLLESNENVARCEFVVQWVSFLLIIACRSQTIRARR